MQVSVPGTYQKPAPYKLQTLTYSTGWAFTGRLPGISAAWAPAMEYIPATEPNSARARGRMYPSQRQGDHQRGELRASPYPELITATLQIPATGDLRCDYWYKVSLGPSMRNQALRSGELRIFERCCRKGTRKLQLRRQSDAPQRALPSLFCNCMSGSGHDSASAIRDARLLAGDSRSGIGWAKGIPRSAVAHLKGWPKARSRPWPSVWTAARRAPTQDEVRDLNFDRAIRSVSLKRSTGGRSTLRSCAIRLLRIPNPRPGCHHG